MQLDYAGRILSGMGQRGNGPRMVPKNACSPTPFKHCAPLTTNLWRGIATLMPHSLIQMGFGRTRPYD